MSNYLLNFNAAWELDIWGKVRRSVESSQASAQASAATLEGVRLSAQATLAQSYFQLRALDEQKRLLDDIAAAFQKILDRTKNRYASGVASRNDVALAETQLKNTQAQAIDLGVQRAQLEHAIATLIGKPASTFAIPRGAGGPEGPGHTRRGAFGTPGAPPRHRRRRKEHGRGQRPDRRGPGGLLPHHYPERHRRLRGLRPRPSGLPGPAASGPWARPRRRPCSTAACAAAQTDAARAAYDSTVATYRQTVLTGFQEVEDNLAALRILEEEAKVQDEAVKAARLSVTLSTNQYQAGTISTLDLLVVVTVARNNERTAITILGNRMSASVLLIKALGGGWKSSDLPAAAKRTPAVNATVKSSDQRDHPEGAAGLSLAEESGERVH